MHNVEKSTWNRIVAKVTVGISRSDNSSAKIFIGCYLEFKLNLVNTEGRTEIWLNVRVDNLTITISKIFGHKIKILPGSFLKNRVCFPVNFICHNSLDGMKNDFHQSHHIVIYYYTSRVLQL